MMPATASLLVTAYRGRDRALALGIWGGMAAAGSAIGPVVGGFLTSHYSWRWGFRINVFVAALLLIGSVLITEARDTEERPSIDWLGVALSATGITSLVFAIIESSTYGWWRALQVFHVGGWRLSLGGFSVVPAALLLGTLLLLGFFFWEQYLTARRRTPLVSMKLFANKQFTSGAMLMVSWEAALVLIVASPVMIVFFILVGGAIHERASRQEAAFGRLAAQFEDRIRALPTILAADATDMEKAKLGQRMRAYADSTFAVLRVAFLNAGIIDFFSSISIAILAVLLGLGHLKLIAVPGFSALELWQSLFILMLAPEFFAPLRRYAEQYHVKSEGTAAAAALARIAEAGHV